MISTTRMVVEHVAPQVCFKWQDAIMGEIWIGAEAPSALQLGRIVVRSHLMPSPNPQS